MSEGPTNQPPPLHPKPTSRRKRSRAWGLAIANQLALPGIGTVMAGRKIGYLQLGLSLSGFALTTIAGIYTLANFRDWIPLPESEDVILNNFRKWKPWLLMFFLGVVLFAMSWLMALFSSGSIVKDSPGNNSGS